MKNFIKISGALALLALCAAQQAQAGGYVATQNGFQAKVSKNFDTSTKYIAHIKQLNSSGQEQKQDTYDTASFKKDVADNFFRTNTKTVIELYQGTKVTGQPAYRYYLYASSPFKRIELTDTQENNPNALQYTPNPQATWYRATFYN